MFVLTGKDTKSAAYNSYTTPSLNDGHQCDPVWVEQCKLAYTHIDDCVVVEVYHDKPIKPELIGRVVLPMALVVDNAKSGNGSGSAFERWCPLLDTLGNPTSNGHVYVGLKLSRVAVPADIREDETRLTRSLKLPPRYVSCVCVSLLTRSELCVME